MGSEARPIPGISDSTKPATGLTPEFALLLSLLWLTQAFVRDAQPASDADLTVGAAWASPVLGMAE